MRAFFIGWVVCHIALNRTDDLHGNIDYPCKGYILDYLKLYN